MIIKFKIFEDTGSFDLFKAVHSMDSGKVRAVIEAGYDVNCKDDKGWTPFV
jgi:ankyrin repeat protein